MVVMMILDQYQDLYTQNEDRKDIRSKDSTSTTECRSIQTVYDGQMYVSFTNFITITCAKSKMMKPRNIILITVINKSLKRDM
jgi:hypothetical protein